MILFKEYHVPMILSGQKTETRRSGRRRWNVGAVHQAKTKMFGPPFARLRIKAVWQEQLGKIGRKGARAEGYCSVERYREVWTLINGIWDPDILVWVVRFQLVLYGEKCRTCDLLPVLDGVCAECGAAGGVL